MKYLAEEGELGQARSAWVCWPAHCSWPLWDGRQLARLVTSRVRVVSQSRSDPLTQWSPVRTPGDYAVAILYTRGGNKSQHQPKQGVKRAKSEPLEEAKKELCPLSYCAMIKRTFIFVLVTGKICCHSHKQLCATTISKKFKVVKSQI